MVNGCAATRPHLRPQRSTGVPEPLPRRRRTTGLHKATVLRGGRFRFPTLAPGGFAVPSERRLLSMSQTTPAVPPQGQAPAGPPPLMVNAQYVKDLSF